MYNVVKWPNIILKSCGVTTARFLKYVWPFYNIMHETVNLSQYRGSVVIFNNRSFFVQLKFSYFTYLSDNNNNNDLAIGSLVLLK